MEPILTMPDEGEVRGLTNEALVSRSLLGVERFDRRALGLPDAALDTAFLPEAGIGRWPARVLLGHLADAEIVNVHRMRRAVGEAQPVLGLWDENAFVDAGMYGDAHGGARFPVAGFVATIHTLRKWGGEWLATLDARAWERRALHPERGELTLRRIVEDNVLHLERHAVYLNLKVARLLAAGG